MQIPLVILAVLAIFAGFLDIPYTEINVTFFSSFLSTALPAEPLVHANPALEIGLTVAAVVATLLGIYLAYLFFLRNPVLTADLVRTPWGATLHRWWLAGWGFDWLYERLFVRPVVWLADVSRDDFVDLVYRAIAWANRVAWRLLSFTQSGQLRWYAMGIAFGAVLIIGIGAFQ